MPIVVRPPSYTERPTAQRLYIEWNSNLLKTWQVFERFSICDYFLHLILLLLFTCSLFHCCSVAALFAAQHNHLAAQSHKFDQFIFIFCCFLCVFAVAFVRSLSLCVPEFAKAIFIHKDGFEFPTPKHTHILRWEALCRTLHNIHICACVGLCACIVSVANCSTKR